MTDEHGVTERERKAFEAGAAWWRSEEESGVAIVDMDDEAAAIAAEAQRRYPPLDVQQGPSGQWYRLVSRCGRLSLRSWESQDGALKDLPINWRNGVEPGDEAAVAGLLQRHAARRSA